MIRGLLLVLVLGAAAVGAVVLSSGGDDLPEYKVVLDNSFGLTEGADLRSAGVAIGSIESLDVERGSNHAIITVGVSEPAFADFRTDVFCQVQPQSLIGEYFLDCRPGSEEERLPAGGTIPVEQTAGTIPPDLVNNILRRPEREKFGLILAELGIAFATREDDVQATLQRAVPALRETNEVLDILARNTSTINQLNRDAEVVLGDLSGNRDDVARFVSEARDTAAATASRRADLETTIDLLPDFLRELRPTMTELGNVAREQTPALRDLRASSGDLTTLFERLGPFAEASRPAVRSLGEVSQTGTEAVREAGDTVAILRDLGASLVDPATNLRFVTEHLNDREFAVERNRLSPGGEGFTGFESFLQYIFAQTQAINLFDTRGYILKLTALINECSGFAGEATIRDKPERIDECANAIGPNGPGQPGSRADTSGTPEGEATPQAPTQTGETEPREEASRREARRQATSNEGGSAGSPERERGGVGELLESLGAPGGGDRPDPGETLRRGLEGAAPTRPGPRPAPQDGGQALLDFLLAP